MGTKKDIKVVESTVLCFHYHLKVKGEEKTLCGKEMLTLPTNVTVNGSWGVVTKLREHYCEECNKKLMEIK